MNTHDIELPPMPVPRTKTDGGIELFAEYSVRDYARAAIELYQRRIEELESQLEAIGAGGVSSQRITSPSKGEPVALGGQPFREQPAEPVKVSSDDERAAQGLPPYNPRHLTEEEWSRLAENGRRAWGNHSDDPSEVPSVPPTKRSFTVEPHGNGYAIYQGRDNFHHGLNLASLTECTPEFAKRIESALNESAEQTDKECLSVAEPEKEPPCET